MGWTKRIERAESFREDGQAAVEVLQFYEKILRVQADFAEELATTGVQFRADRPFREQLDLGSALRQLPRLESVTKQFGTAVLRSEAEALKHGGVEAVRTFMEKEIRGERLQEAQRFFALALLQPLAESLSQQCHLGEHSGNRCPVCDGLPLLAVLRPEGDGAKRSLQCSLCLTEWLYRRVLCPWCGETDKDKLPRYTVEECGYVRVEACDTCKKYLKSVDLTLEGRAVPMVDEVALAALDVWAVEQGFTKIASNLLGF
jgi:FdhE protein